MPSLKAMSHCPEIDPKWTHGNEVLHDLWEFFWQPKIPQRLSKLMLMQEKHNQGSYDGLRCPQECPNVLMILFFTITSELLDSVRPTLRSPSNLKISLNVCSSGVNLRTV